MLFVTHDIDEAIYLARPRDRLHGAAGAVKADIRIDLPRPRAIEIKKTVPYLEYRNRAWDLLREEVLRARELES